jgi:ATP phosphoribosyltransferase
MKLKLGIPQGRLQAPVIDLFRHAGFEVRANNGSYYPSVDDPDLECVLIRSEEIPCYTAEGIVDAGITGDDWIQEYESGTGTASLKIIENLLCPSLGLGHVRWVLAVPESSNIEKIRDLEGTTVSSELVEVTKRWLADHGVNARVVFSWGATELKPPTLAAAIVQPETAETNLRQHKLRTVAEIMQSRPRLVCNRAVLHQESPIREKLDQVRLLLNAAISAQGKVRLVIETNRGHRQDLEGLIEAVTPVMVVGDGDAITLNAIVQQTSVRDLIPRLKAAGAVRVIETSLNKFVL